MVTSMFCYRKYTNYQLGVTQIEAPWQRILHILLKPVHIIHQLLLKLQQQQTDQGATYLSSNKLQMKRCRQWL